MINHFEKENLINWISEYAQSDAAKRNPPEIQSGGPFFLQELVLKTIEKTGDIESIEEKDLGEELMALSNRYDLSKLMKNHLPAYIGDFFEDLERQGRFGDGRVFGKFIRTFKGRLGPQTIRNPGSKLGRNDPCPCGSGLKFKKCCQGKC